MKPIVIIGTGMAGYTLAKEFRKLDSATPLIMITADDGRNYSKPMLSTGFTKNKDADALATQTPETMAEQLNAQILTATRVGSIDRNSNEVVLDDGQRIAYGKLVLGLGAEPVRPPMAGNALDKVFTVNDLEDYAKFRAALPEGGKVAILGAGLIGCEFANDLHNGGHAAEIIAPSDTVMPGLIPEQAAAAVKAALVGLGTRFHLQHYATTINQSGEGVELTLDNDEKITADIVLSAVGLRPRTSLAEQAGLEVKRGISVDRTLATNDPDIFAFGDCAEVDGRVLLYVMPLMTCARALAKTLAGEVTQVSYGPMPVAVKTPACPIVVSPPTEEGEWAIEEVDGGLRLLCKTGDQLVGYTLTGSLVNERMQLNKQLPPVMA